MKYSNRFLDQQVNEETTVLIKDTDGSVYEAHYSFIRPYFSQKEIETMFKERKTWLIAPLLQVDWAISASLLYLTQLI